AERHELPGDQPSVRVAARRGARLEEPLVLLVDLPDQRRGQQRVELTTEDRLLAIGALLFGGGQVRDQLAIPGHRRQLLRRDRSGRRGRVVLDRRRHRGRRGGGPVRDDRG